MKLCNTALLTLPLLAAHATLTDAEDNRPQKCIGRKIGPFSSSGDRLEKNEAICHGGSNNNKLRFGINNSGKLGLWKFNKLEVELANGVETLEMNQGVTGTSDITEGVTGPSVITAYDSNGDGIWSIECEGLDVVDDYELLEAELFITNDSAFGIYVRFSQGRFPQHKLWAIVDDKDQGYETEVYKKCEVKEASPSDKYDCEKRNPCTEENAGKGKFYFKASNSKKFIQCSEWGQCYEKRCPSGLVWDQSILACNYP